MLERPNVSFVTGVDKRVWCQAHEIEEGHVHFDLPQFKTCASGKLEGGKIKYSERVSDDGQKTLKFVVASIETCSRYFSFKGWGFKGVEIKSLSDPAFGFGASKAGLGSSAAATVATVGALFELNGKAIAQNLPLVHRVSQFVHSTAQGKVGSGFDVTAACFGGCKYVRYSPALIPLEEIGDERLAAVLDSEWNCVTEKIDLPNGFEIAMASFEGESTSTSEMVKLVNKFKAESPEEYSAIMGKINEANDAAIEAMRKINRKYNENPRDFLNLLSAVEADRGADHLFEEFYGAFRQGRLLTKQLGELSGAQIESDECFALIEESDKNGAFAAKLPGAGGGDAIAALCIGKQAKARLEEFWKNYREKKLNVLRVAANNAGARLESELPQLLSLLKAPQ